MDSIKYRSDGGNVVFMIIISIAFFSAVTVALQHSYFGEQLLTNKESKLYAQEIIAYGEKIENAVEKLLNDGCSFNQISFDHEEYSKYENANSPDNGTCHIFEDSGADITWKKFSERAYRTNLRNISGFAEPIFTIKNRIAKLSEDEHKLQLMFLTKGLQQLVCHDINYIISKDSNISYADELIDPYIGDINLDNIYIFPKAFDGKKRGCFQDHAGTNKDFLTYYHVIAEYKINDY